MPRAAPKKQRPGNRDPSQLGIFAIPDLDMGGEDDGIGSDDDDDLEAELNAILASGPPKPKAKRPPPKPVAAAANLDAMVAESLRDIPSDEDLSADEDDPSLLAELNAVTGDGEPEDEKPSKTIQPMTNSGMDTLKVLYERIAMYMQAEENSKAVGDTLKVRRLGRGLKTLNELVKKAEAGAIIDEADIPMPVSIAAKQPGEEDLADKPPEIFAPLDMDGELPAPLLPQRAAPPVPPPRASPRPQMPPEESQPVAAAVAPPAPSSVVPIDDAVLKILVERRDQYKRAAVSAKRDGKSSEAIGFVKIAKKFDAVIEAASEGRPVDLSTMPPPPPGMGPSTVPIQSPTTLPRVQPEGDPPAPATVMEALEQRLAKFQQQEENAKAEGNSGKARRNGRIVKQYQDAIKLHRAGKPFPVDELPTPPGYAPIPVAGAAKPAPVPPPSQSVAPPPPSTPSEDDHHPAIPPRSPLPPVKAPATSQQEKLTLLLQKQNQFKAAALKAKEDGNLPLAKENLRHYRSLEPLIEAMKIEIPQELISKFNSAVEDALAGRAVDIDALMSASASVPNSIEVPTGAQQTAEPTDSSDDPPAPSTVLEALEQRLAKFQQQEENAKAEGNSGKARRNGRIVKQYQDAIKLHRAGKPFPVDELPTPPGFAPIPVPGASTVSAGPSSTLSPGKRLEPASPSSSSPATPQRSPLPSQKGVGGTKQEKQLTLLMQKQKQFRDAALKAKQDGDLPLAKEYLRQFKCFEPLIEAAKGGFPVDMTSLPAPPGSSQVIEKEYEIVKLNDCLPGTTSEMYTQLINDLNQQLKLCMETRAHFKAIGDVASANKFEQLAVSSKKDLDTVKIACNKDQPIPKFHYERRIFDVVRCNTDLTDNEMEISVLQGVNYNVPNPKEIDTYVRFEFPAPSNEEPKRDKTSTVYNTNNPAYDAKFMISIPRSNRNFQRLFRRHALKLEVWSKGGFLRSDSLVGTVNVKLLPLETVCTIHDSFDLMDGRKPLGGKLEVKIRIRHPIQTKQVEQLREKWLVVD
ncbi:hypothetical protein GE061_009345 [Apolygus lucorum]|uniref:Uncharacterized protein n=1 Tax=Apolygus lucorum TaxID=248454 RepID=A0A6A4KBU4_APOLU|nr:hypothetical protein GE061_009345 [Apolygus lucorum]